MPSLRPQSLHAPLFAAVLFAFAAPVPAAPAEPASATLPVDRSARSLLERHNKALVQRFYDDVIAPSRVDQLDRYVAAALIQHDPTVGAGRQGLAEQIKARATETPRSTVTIKRSIADGPFVLVHSQRSTTPGSELSGTAQIDLYRLDSERIVEHWAIRQAVPPSSASGRSMFSDDYRYAGTPEAPSQVREETNKALAMKLLTTLFAGQDTSVIDRYWSPAFIQHNPQAPDGTAPLQGIGFVPKPTPFGAWNTRIAVAEGDLVFVLSQSVAATENLASDFNGSAAGDLFRIVGGKLVEHWDVLGAVPASSVNGNSPFSELFVAPR